jgi:hypothetical protein
MQKRNSQSAQDPKSQGTQKPEISVAKSGLIKTLVVALIGVVTAIVTGYFGRWLPRPVSASQ